MEQERKNEKAPALLPLYKRITKKRNGDVSETMVGPNAVQGVKYIAYLILGIVLILKTGGLPPHPESISVLKSVESFIVGLIK